MTGPLKIDLPPEALKALEEDGVVVIPKAVDPSIQKAVLQTMAFSMFGPRMMPTFRYRCMLYVSHPTLALASRGHMIK